MNFLFLTYCITLLFILLKFWCSFISAPGAVSPHRVSRPSLHPAWGLGVLSGGIVLPCCKLGKKTVQAPTVGLGLSGQGIPGLIVWGWAVGDRWVHVLRSLVSLPEERRGEESVWTRAKGTFWREVLSLRVSWRACEDVDHWDSDSAGLSWVPESPFLMNSSMLLLVVNQRA